MRGWVRNTWSVPPPLRLSVYPSISIPVSPIICPSVYPSIPWFISITNKHPQLNRGIAWATSAASNLCLSRNSHTHTTPLSVTLLLRSALYSRTHRQPFTWKTRHPCYTVCHGRTPHTTALFRHRLPRDGLPLSQQTPVCHAHNPRRKHAPREAHPYTPVKRRMFNLNRPAIVW